MTDETIEAGEAPAPEPEREPLDLELVKRVLEAALLSASEPLTRAADEAPVRGRARRREPAPDPRRAEGGMGRALGGAHPGGERLALPREARLPEVPRPHREREGAALLARGARDPGDHRLPPAGHARRHRGHPRRGGLARHAQGPRGARLDRRGRPPRKPRPPGALRHHAPLPGRPEPEVARGAARARGAAKHPRRRPRSRAGPGAGTAHRPPARRRHPRPTTGRGPPRSPPRAARTEHDDHAR